MKTDRGRASQYVSVADANCPRTRDSSFDLVAAARSVGGVAPTLRPLDPAACVVVGVAIEEPLLELGVEGAGGRGAGGVGRSGQIATSQSGWASSGRTADSAPSADQRPTSSAWSARSRISIGPLIGYSPRSRYSWTSSSYRVTKSWSTTWMFDRRVTIA